MLVTPVLAAIFHLLRLGQAVTSTTVLASLLTTRCREVFLPARSRGGTVTTVSKFETIPVCSPAVSPYTRDFLTLGSILWLKAYWDGKLTWFPFRAFLSYQSCQWWHDHLRFWSPWYTQSFGTPASVSGFLFALFPISASDLLSWALSSTFCNDENVLGLCCPTE